MNTLAPHSCAHCGLPLGARRLAVQVSGEERVFCCGGCAFVYELAGGGDASGGSAASWFLMLLGFSAVLSGFIMTFSWGLYLNPGLPASVRDTVHYVLLGLATPVIFGVGYPYLSTAVREARRGLLSMSSLIALGTVSAYTYSAYLTFRHADQVYFDSATMVIVLVTVGRYLQARSRARAAQAMRKFVARMPSVAVRVRDGQEENIDSGAIVPGDVLRVLPGSVIPADGCIRQGRTTVDESLLTGEALPVTRGPGDLLLQGTMNLDGAVLLEVVQVGEGTLQAQIERLLTGALAARMPLQAEVDRASSLFVGFTVLLAAGTALYSFSQGRTAAGLLNALAVLVVACPCALGLATPLAAFVALQAAAREGVLLRSMEALEKLARVDTVVFDKTGTLTQGMLSVEEVCVSARADVTAEELLRIAGSLEQCSEHHAGRAIAAEAKRRGASLLAVRDFVNHPGEGVEGSVAREATDLGSASSWRQVALGTLTSLRDRAMELPADLETFTQSAPESVALGTVVYVGWEGHIRGSVLLADRLRPGALELVARCRRMGLEVHLLSGDRNRSAERVARELEIEHWAGEQRPAQKVEYVAALQKLGKIVAMVGDGVNDAPSLAQADVGFTHEVGTDLSREAADAHILGVALEGVPWSVAHARNTMRHIHQNLFWAFFYNTVAMSLAALGYLQPIFAAGAMIASSVMVTGNSLRLRTTGRATSEPFSKFGRAEQAGPPQRSTAFADPETPRVDPASSA